MAIPIWFGSVQDLPNPNLSYFFRTHAHTLKKKMAPNFLTLLGLLTYLHFK